MADYMKSFTLHLVLLVVLSLLLPASAMARMATAVWYEKLPEGVTFETPPNMSKDQARVEAFTNVVMDEAAVLLHADVPQERLVYLREYLAPRASQLVVSYTELGTEPMNSGHQVSVDVQVNREQLRHELKRLGMFDTLRAPLTYSPQYGTVLPETWEALGRLHVLYGLTPNSESPLSLRIHLDGKVWTLTLRNLQDAQAAPFFATAKNLEDAWHKVWGGYFDSLSSGTVQGATAVLSIDGWFTPDGVEAFDSMLQEWTDVLGMVSLQDVTMEAAGIRGDWAVQVLDAEGLRTRLTEYASKRRLSFELKDK